MATLQAELKRGILDELWHAAPEGVSLEDCIRAYKSLRFADIKSGRFVTNTSGGGYSVGFNVPEVVRALSPDQMFMLCQEFLDLLTSARTTQAAQGNASPDDETLFATMMDNDQLQTVREFQRDYTTLRWPSVGVRSS